MRGLYFRETSHMRSSVKIKPTRNGKITLSFIDICKSCLNREFVTSLMCLLMLFAKMKYSRNFRIYRLSVFYAVHKVVVNTNKSTHDN